MTPPPLKLRDQNAVITGASLGLGRAIAAECLAQGASLVLCARDPAGLEEAAAELRAEAAEDQRVIAVPCDVSFEDEVARLAETAFAELGEIDILINNAGIVGPIGAAEEADLVAWIRTIEINLLGTFLPCRAFIPHFKQKHHGKIVIVSGGGATHPMPNFSAYAASKAAVVRLAETLAEELAPFGVQVNAIAPGALKTRMMDEALAAGPERAGRAYHAKLEKWAQGDATPLELAARLAVHLASRDSGSITGKLISAVWDPWEDGTLEEVANDLCTTDIYTLRRITPRDRDRDWDPRANL